MQEKQMLKLIHLSTSLQVWNWKTCTLNNELNRDRYVHVFSRCQRHLWPYKCLEIAAGRNGVQHFKAVFFIVVIFFKPNMLNSVIEQVKLKFFSNTFKIHSLVPPKSHPFSLRWQLSELSTRMNLTATFPVSINVPCVGSSLLKRKTRTRLKDFHLYPNILSVRKPYCLFICIVYTSQCKVIEYIYRSHDLYGHTMFTITS